MSVELIMIPKSEYNRLLKDSQFLKALQAAGVDNWEGYTEVLKKLKEKIYYE